MVLFHAIDAPISPFSPLSRKRRMGEALILEGSADTTAVEIYIEQILAPSLQAGQIVILDNLSTHTGEKVRQAIEARGCQLLFLPSYSPDFSPIEEAFSKRDPPFYAWRESAPQRPCKRLLDKPFSRSPLTMPLFVVYSLWVLLRPTFVFPRGRIW
jgi:hypothetical protein